MSADMMDWMKYPDGEEVTYNYDARILLDSVAGTNTYVFDTQYDSAGRVTSRELGNGLVQTFGYYGWDEKVNNLGQGGRLETLATGTLQNLAYVYDSVGNIEHPPPNTNARLHRDGRYQLPIPQPTSH